MPHLTEIDYHLRLYWRDFISTLRPMNDVSHQGCHVVCRQGIGQAPEDGQTENVRGAGTHRTHIKDIYRSYQASWIAHP
jgi:hypothetical protein